MSNDGWKKVSQGSRGEPWKYEKKGDTVSGVYVDQREIPNKLQPGTMTKIYALQQSNGSEVAVFGKTALDRDMAKVKVGDEVRIVYLGKEKNPKSGFSFHTFEVSSRKADAQTAKAEDKEEVEVDDIPF